MTEPSPIVACALKEFFETSTDPVLFTGAGVSMLAGLPDWKGLLTQMAESVRVKDMLTANMITQCIAKGSLTKAADYFWLSDEVLEGEKYSTLKSVLGNFNIPPLKPLASLPFKSVLTTNFDRSIIEAIATAQGQVPRDYRLGDPSISTAVWETELYVARIHGCIEMPGSMILSESQFKKLLDNDSYIELLTQTFLRKNVLFLGFSFYDPAIKYVLEQIDKRQGPAAPGRHLSILPEDNAADLIQKAHRLNIKVIKYATADSHKALWDGINQYAVSRSQIPTRTVVVVNQPHSVTKQYLAACYTRVSIDSAHTPLREIVIEGILSASFQEAHPKSLGLADIHENVRKALGLKGKEINQLVDNALKELIVSKLIRKHHEEGVKGARFVWIGKPEAASTLDNALETLKKNICDRAHVQEGWKPPEHVVNVIDNFLKEVVHRRGWDLGAAFAAGKAPDIFSFRPVLAECGYDLSAFDRERLERTIESLFQHPTVQEATLLGELGRISFALELAFQAPRTTLIHKATLPHRIYFDANLLLPMFIEGHPHSEIYSNTLAQLQAASSKAGIRLQLIAYRGYLNEMISHKNAALTYMDEAGKDFESLARTDAIYHGSGNINVFVGAYVTSVVNGHLTKGFEKFLKRVAPYSTESELSHWLEKRGFLVVNSPKTTIYARIYDVLEHSNALKLSNGKLPILIEHDALQLSLLENDFQKGVPAVFVTADRQLYEGILQTQFGHLADGMVSHVGIVQLVDLLVGLKSDERVLGELLWSSKVSERAQRIRSYLTIEALSKYDEALAMTMHGVVEAQSDAIARQMERDGADLEATDPKARIRALKSLDSLEANFFSGMSGAIENLKKLME
jgi:hypothetical protein